MSSDFTPLDMLYALVLETGEEWGQVAAPFQLADAEAILGENGPRRHFLTRPRGGSKTTDLAGLALAWLAVAAPPMSRGYVVAANVDQAAILIDAAAGFVARTPALSGTVEVQNEKIIGPEGAWMRVLACSDSGAWGLRDARFLILDEFAQWPETRGAKRVYLAVRTTVQKTPGCRLVILTSAGEPSHWSYEIWQKAHHDPSWRVADTPGPVPWQDPKEIEALRRELTPSAFSRLIENVWTAEEDRAISEEDWYLAAVPFRPAVPVPGTRYVIAVDIGIYQDATVAVLAHAEREAPDNPRSTLRVVVDHVERWKGSRKKPVQLSAVEEWIVDASRKFNHAKVYADPTQFRGYLQNLRRRGVAAQEFTFSTQSVGDLASALVMAFRNRQITVPDTPDLREELLSVRLKQITPGVVRLAHDPLHHDDQAVTIGMVCQLLLGGTSGTTSAFLASLKEIAERKERTPLRPTDPLKLPVRTPRRTRCEHRWRGNTCVFCGFTEEVPCPS
jgi:hypothetical protein